MVVTQSLMLPGHILLPPGTYQLETLERSSVDATAVMISSVDNRNRAGMFVQARRTVRTDAGPAIDLRGGHGGSAAELAAWFPGGGTTGYTFAPQSVPNAQQIAAAEKRLRDADTTVEYAKQQLKAATANRDAIRTEQTNGR
jgi:hypothetical protein